MQREEGVPTSIWETKPLINIVFCHSFVQNPSQTKPAAKKLRNILMNKGFPPQNNSPLSVDDVCCARYSPQNCFCGQATGHVQSMGLPAR